MGSYFFERIFPEVLDKINLISLIASCLSIALMLALGYFSSFIFNRVTIRFQALIVAVDLLRHVRFLILKQSDGPFCNFLGFFGYFTDHMYMFINVIIAINVQLLYLHDVRPKRKLELILLFFAFTLAVVLDGILFIFDAYGQNGSGKCFLKKSPNKTTFKIVLLYTTLPPGMIYCLGVFTAVIMSLYLRKDYIDSKFPDKRMLVGGEVVNARDFVKKLYFRMSFYPVTSFLCFLGYLFVNFLRDVKAQVPEILKIFGRIGIRSTGILNFIALLCDPHFHIAVKSIWLAREEYEYRAELETDIELKTTRDLKKEEPKYYVDFAGRDPLPFEEYIRFL